MRRFKLLLAAGTAAAMMLAFGTAQASTTTETRHYMTGVSGAVESCLDTPAGEVDLGAACLGGVLPGQVIDVSLADDSGLSNVAAIYNFADAGGNLVGGLGFFCGSRDAIVVPDGASTLFVGTGADSVAIDAALSGSLCNPATTGTATFTITTDEG